MVFRKKLDEGSGGGTASRQPRKPRAAPLAPVKRSARLKKKQMYALNLLASVAESLSSDDEEGSSSGSDMEETEAGYNSKGTSVKVEQLDEVPPSVLDSAASEDDCPPLVITAVENDCSQLVNIPVENGCSPLVNIPVENGCSPLVTAALENDCCKGYAVGCAGICASLSQTNLCKMEGLSTPDVAGTVSSEPLIRETDVLVKGSLVSCANPCLLGHGLGTIPEYGTIGACPPWSTELAVVKQEPQSIPVMITGQVDGIAETLHTAVHTMDLDTKPPPMVTAESSSGVHLDGPDKGQKSSPLCSNTLQHAADRDVDEKFPPSVHPSTSRSKGGYLPHYLGDCRTRRLFATKMRKAARNKICGEMSNKGSKLNIRGKKIAPTRRRAQTQRTILKTKKIAECYSAQPSDEETLTETSGCGTSFPMGGQDPACASESGQKRPCASEGYNVKFIIKSFNIPELLIEVPENATVGSLKRIVTDAVTTTIEGSLRVRVLLQGKIIQDDNTTLHQAGICHGAKLDSIGFSLECEAKQDCPPSVITPQETHPVGTPIVQTLSKIKCEEPSPSFTLGGPGDYPFGGNALVKSEIAEAMAAVGTSNVGALAIVPAFRSKQRDFGQRRKRRPFSIPEVESLVQAVEQLGFGRWKNVKYHAFGDNQERTYVDLKDKWKNLVHTASIPPQLRRGQAIPSQELLDRVLAAQAYWSLRQPKLEERLTSP